MPPFTASRYPHIQYNDSSYVARIARNKIYREFHRADPNLRQCVGHANMLDRINDNAGNVVVVEESPAPEQRKGTPSKDAKQNTEDHAADFQARTRPKLQTKKSTPNVGAKERERNLSLHNHFYIDNDSTPTPMPTVSVVSIEVEEDESEEEWDEFPATSRPVAQKQGYAHAPPLLTRQPG